MVSPRAADLIVATDMDGEGCYQIRMPFEALHSPCWVHGIHASLHNLIGLVPEPLIIILVDGEGVFIMPFNPAHTYTFHICTFLHTPCCDLSTFHHRGIIIFTSSYHRENGGTVNLFAFLRFVDVSSAV